MEGAVRLDFPFSCLDSGGRFLSASSWGAVGVKPADQHECAGLVAGEATAGPGRANRYQLCLRSRPAAAGGELSAGRADSLSIHLCDDQADVAGGGACLGKTVWACLSDLRALDPLWALLSRGWASNALHLRCGKENPGGGPDGQTGGAVGGWNSAAGGDPRGGFCGRDVGPFA